MTNKNVIFFLQYKLHACMFIGNASITFGNTVKCVKTLLDSLYNNEQKYTNNNNHNMNFKKS